MQRMLDDLLVRAQHIHSLPTFHSAKIDVAHVFVVKTELEFVCHSHSKLWIGKIQMNSTVKCDAKTVQEMATPKETSAESWKCGKSRLVLHEWECVDSVFLCINLGESIK